jgi:predicted hydrocarbon binding protein
MSSLTQSVPSTLSKVGSLGLPLLDRLAERPLLARLAVRAGLIGGSLVNGRLFWVRAALGQNQLEMHDCDKDGTISIGGVSEQFFSEGFIPAWHDVLTKQLGAKRAAEALYEVGQRGARWEVEEAVRHGVWVPALLRRFVGRPELLAKVKASKFYHALTLETLHILYRMIMTQGGWGVVEGIDLLSQPALVHVSNTPESRQLGVTGKPSCHIARGIYTGYLATVFGVETSGVEVACRCQGDPRCTFAITLG